MVRVIEEIVYVANSNCSVLNNVRYMVVGISLNTVSYIEVNKRLTIIMEKVLLPLGLIFSTPNWI